MRIKNLNKPGSKLHKYPDWLLIIIVLLLFLSLILSFDVLFRPYEITENILDNHISENAGYKLKAEVKPCSLYPNGGIVEPEGFIITRITKFIILDVISTVSADKPVTVNGDKSISYKLIAENLWEKNFSLESEKSFSMSGNRNNIINGQYKINIEEILSYIDRVEKEIVTQPNRYILKFTPALTGNIKYNEFSFPLSQIPDVTFEINNGQIRLINDAQDYIFETNELNNKIPVESLLTTYHDYIFLGLKMPLKTVKYIFPAISLVLGLFSAFLIKSRYGLTGPKYLTESEKINKKYKNRLTFLQGQINTAGKSLLSVESFKDLLNIADDRELSVACVKNKNIDSEYYVTDGDFIYCYKTNEKFFNEDVDFSNMHDYPGSDF